MGQALGFVAIQFRRWDARLFDLQVAAESQDYCDQILGTVRAAGLEVTELSTHLQGQLVASHPAYDLLLEALRPPGSIREASPAMGGAAAALGGPRQPQPWAEGACDVLGRAGVAVLLSLAAAARGPGR